MDLFLSIMLGLLALGFAFAIVPWIIGMLYEAVLLVVEHFEYK